jgi:hypothetical protein
MDGFSLRAHPFEGENEKKIYLGIVRPEGADEKNFREAMLKLGGQFGRIRRPDTAGETEHLAMNTALDLSTNPEIAGPRPEAYTDESGQQFLAFVAREEMLDRLTFAGKTEEELNGVLAEAQKELEAYPAFAGFAIHHYRSYRELCEKKE